MYNKAMIKPAQQRTLHQMLSGKHIKIVPKEIEKFKYVKCSHSRLIPEKHQIQISFSGENYYLV